MPSKKEKMRHLIIFLMNDGCKDFKGALKDPKILAKMIKVKKKGFHARLHLPKPPVKKPAWIEFLKDGFGDDVDVDSNRLSSALLLVKVNGRIFALTFGHARSLLNEDSIELDFGLKVAINTIDPQSIRAINLRMFREMTLKRAEEAAQGTDLRSFTVNVRQDLLRAVAGSPKDSSFASRLNGADSLVMDVPLNFDKLGAKCSELLKAYGNKRYLQTGFKWIENIKAVRDQKTIAELDNVLIDELRAKSEDVLMITPDAFSRNAITGFLYRRERENSAHVELEIKDWYSAVDFELATLNADELRKHRIRIHDSDSNEESIKEYEFFSFEVKKGKDTYVLSNGRWYEIGRDLLQEMKEYLKHVEGHALNFLPAQVGETEDDYLNRLIKVNRDLIMMHRAPYQMPDGAFEICDLLSKQGHLIHVKRWGASATFSHLLRQGAVSAETIRSVEGVRKHIRDNVTKFKKEVTGLFPARDFAPTKIGVVFALIRETDKELPFFSRLSLMREGEQIESMGLYCSL